MKKEILICYGAEEKEGYTLQQDSDYIKLTPSNFIDTWNLEKTNSVELIDTQDGIIIKLKNKKITLSYMDFASIQALITLYITNNPRVIGTPKFFEIKEVI